jgi:hypothetical protein
VPPAVIWECGLLVRAGRINLPRDLSIFFDDLFSNVWQAGVGRRTGCARQADAGHRTRSDDPAV